MNLLCTTAAAGAFCLLSWIHSLSHRDSRSSPSSPACPETRDTGRAPLWDELVVLQNTYAQQLVSFRNDPEAAKALLKVGQSPVPEKADAIALAAMTAVANVLLNLNETITK